ncbi:MAG TPA: NosD domain-containing protein [Methanotrichaceae archaeon]|nr:NosD domain-containing protein [Methanotrichaceae archaeon]HQF17307.1 NosD domain-containing protein [Methanotrichaceae archaeon]HQI91947.1 NosD domain-containing protein [Methanotrichaceae archaeon]HQJ29272.1 NosD domain-containing protein [Methanotrichaceae archaeon]
MSISAYLRAWACLAVLIAASSSILAVQTACAATVTAGPDVQSSIDAASPGDTVLVGPGSFGPLTIRKSMTLIGNGSLVRTSGTNACISVEASGVTVSGFQVRDGLYGIRLNNATGCTIENNTVIGCKQPGIALLFSDNNVIRNNNASFNGLGGEGWYGIYLSNSNGNLIEDNVANNNGAYGINLFPSCNNNTIRRNVLQRNMYGLYMFTSCAYNRILENDMSYNTASGLDLRFNCHHNIMKNNSMVGNVVAGVSYLDCGQNTLSENVIRGNGRFGIQILGQGSENAIIGNNISASPTGIYLEPGNNLIYKNRFIDNVKQVQEKERNRWNAPYPEGGNAWSDYAGEDQLSGPDQDVPGPDGFGDVAYQVSPLSEDRYPVMGARFQPIVVKKSSIEPSRATVGENVIIKAWLDATYGITQVSAKLPQASATGYATMNPEGDHYQGRLVTALLEPGEYQVMVRARDGRGYELEENIGRIEIVARTGRNFDSAMSKIKG